MATKRKRRASPPKGLAPGEQLKRSTLTGNDLSAWGWVGTDVHEPSQINSEHRMATCGLARSSRHPFCPNKYASMKRKRASPPRDTATNGELDDDVIVISDDELPPCSKKLCKGNPNCLNYLGQEKWEDESEYYPRQYNSSTISSVHVTEKAKEAFLEALNLGDDPLLEARDPDIPVGLKVYSSIPSGLRTH